MATPLLGSAASSFLFRLSLTYEAYLRQKVGPIDPNLLSALLAAEDRRFFRHGGIDIIATARAAWYCFVKRQLVGGSTIEQQLVRTITGHTERTLTRKLREILLSTLVTNRVPKTEVPGLYLSLAYFGWRMNGYRDACRRMGISTSRRLSMRQAASIVSRLKYPEPEHPNPRRLQQINLRTEYILRQTASGEGSMAMLAPEAVDGETFLNL
jgi:penicillin-binding protein 1A